RVRVQRRAGKRAVRGDAQPRGSGDLAEGQRLTRRAVVVEDGTGKAAAVSHGFLRRRPGDGVGGEGRGAVEQRLDFVAGQRAVVDPHLVERAVEEAVVVASVAAHVNGDVGDQAAHGAA